VGLLLAALGLALVAIATYTLIRYRDQGLIDWGIYGVVRHPMYLGAILAFLSWALILPGWITVLLAAVNAAICYRFVLDGERQNMARWSEYVAYAARVPRLNLLAGVVQALRR
jgi:protein-S-isoprenylcysteine O-methyltransferase Ste14